MCFCRGMYKSLAVWRYFGGSGYTSSFLLYLSVLSRRHVYSGSWDTLIGLIDCIRVPKSGAGCSLTSHTRPSVGSIAFICP